MKRRARQIRTALISVASLIVTCGELFAFDRFSWVSSLFRLLQNRLACETISGRPRGRSKLVVTTTTRQMTEIRIMEKKKTSCINHRDQFRSRNSASTRGYVDLRHWPNCAMNLKFSYLKCCWSNAICLVPAIVHRSTVNSDNFRMIEAIQATCCIAVGTREKKHTLKSKWK